MSGLGERNMAKKTVTYNGGWPLMQPLGKKESELLKQNLIQGERVLGQVIGDYDQAVIATTHKLLIVKHGMMAGQTFGGKATSFDYRNIMGVEVRTGFVGGEFEVIVGGLGTPAGNRRKDKIKAAESPNAICITAADQKIFQAMAAQIRMMNSQTLAPASQHMAAFSQPAAPASGPLAGRAQPPATTFNHASSPVPIPEQIRQLAELHAAGILTDAEFAAKKAELLRRM
jgi:Short C-terminal domain